MKGCVNTIKKVILGLLWFVNTRRKFLGDLQSRGRLVRITMEHQSIMMHYDTKAFIQSGMLADCNQNFSCGLDSPETKFQPSQWPGHYVPLTLYVEILFSANALRTPYWLMWCHVCSEWHAGWLRPNWYTYLEVKSWQVLLLHIRAARHWVFPSKLHFDAIYPLVAIRFDAIYPSVVILVSRQFRAAYWRIKTKT